MLACGLALYSSTGLAAGEAGLNGADTAWILTSTALVLFMTLPGLALFYGGLVRAQAVLSVLMHCFTICCVASLLWLFGVYSLAFGDGGALNPVIGGLDKAFLAGVGADSLSGTIPETTFFMFQMTFAIITPALIAGAYPERVNFPVVILFSAIWLILVYAPAAHWVWGGGWLADLGVMDFAGGIVVHVTAGVSALVLAVVLGGRRGFPREITPPHSPGMTMTGAAMLWVGWFGFNAGSALAADGSASMAMTVTHVSAAVGALSWAVTEWVKYGKPSLIGTVTGMVAGLASITPASGFVGPVGALVIGLVGGLLCFAATMYIKRVVKIDDSLDVFAVHGVGGALGAILTAVFAATSLGGMGLAEGGTMGGQVLVQLLGVGVVAVWSGVVTFAIVKIIGFVVALRVSEEDEIEGLDIVAHGERAYELQTLAR
ncbi:MAG: ammonium transporter, partial [Rhodospirillales bacterium]|nr:ammonium transporter [Rhodospirillales bacterium]